MSEDRDLFRLYFETHRSLQAAVVDAHAPALAALLDGVIVQAQAAGEVLAPTCRRASSASSCRPRFSRAS